MLDLQFPFSNFTQFKMEKIKFTQFVIIFSAVILTEVIAFPTPAVSTGNEPPSPLFRNVINKNFEIVEGPKEFLLPLAPLKSILTKHLLQTGSKREERSGGSAENTSPSPGRLSDLDYMVYGKVYLMKALGVSSRSAIGDTEASTTEESLTISFPTQRPVDGRRTYRYKYFYTPKPSDYKDKEASDERSSSILFENRKLETRSAEKLNDEGDVNESSELDLVPTTTEIEEAGITSATSAPVVSPVKEKQENDFMADEEAVELLRKLMPQALAYYENEGKSGNSTSDNSKEEKDNSEINEEIPGSELNTANNENNNNSSGINVEDRFLINVPQKAACPNGQKKNHRGICKPIFVYNPSPRDELMSTMTRRRLTSSSNPQMHASNLRESDGTEQHAAAASERRNFHLSALFASFLKLEKSLEKAAKEAEEKLGHVRGVESVLAESKENRTEGGDDRKTDDNIQQKV